eukprot:366305-Chlamydomonas_euryale.AAC.1
MTRAGSGGAICAGRRPLICLRSRAQAKPAAVFLLPAALFPLCLNPVPVCHARWSAWRLASAMSHASWSGTSTRSAAEMRSTSAPVWVLTTVPVPRRLERPADPGALNA